MTTALDALTVPLAGTQLIEASAGTGKTYTIATLFVRLVIERKLEVDEILVVTFTNAATAELRDRVRKRLREALQAFEEGAPSADPMLRQLVQNTPKKDAARGRLTRALGAIDEAAIHTIHGFSQRVLSEHAFEGGVRPELELLADVRPLVAELVDDFWTEHVETAPRPAVEYLRARGTGATRLTQLGLLAVRTPDAPVVIDEGEVDLEKPIEGYFAARKRVVEAWPDARDQVHGILTTSIALNKNHYPEESRAFLTECMDAFVAVTEESLEGYTREVSKFSQQQLTKSTKAKQIAPSHGFFRLCEDLATARGAVDASLERWAQSLEATFVHYVRQELPLRTAALSSLSFDDLLLGLRKALRGPRARALVAALRRRFPAALIDEFQDTDPIQYEIFRRVYSGKGMTLFVIGDPKQAIYAFRGADIFAYLEAVNHADGRYTLGTNHRSDPALVRGVNAVFSRTENPFLIDEIRFEPVNARSSAEDGLRLGGTPYSGLEFVHLRRTGGDGERGKPAVPKPESIAKIAATEIARLLHARPTLRRSAPGAPARELVPGDFAVLTRANKDCHDVQRELRALGVPSVLHGDSSVLETEEAVEMKRILAALAGPTSGTNVRSALSTNLFGLSATDLFALGEDEGAWEKWTSDFARWHAIFKDRGFLQAIRALFVDCSIPERVLGRVGGERTLTNFTHLTELCHRAAVDLHLGVAGLVAWFDEIRHNDEQKNGVAAEYAQVRLESDEYAVQLTTMHRSKGLEYPIVVLPYLWKPSIPFSNEKRHLRYHDPKRGHGVTLDLRLEEQKEAALQLATHESLAEGTRLVYVALTRARHRCIVLWGPLSGFADSALVRLLHPRLVDQGDVKHASDAALGTDLESLSRESGGAVTVRAWDDGPVPVYRAEQNFTRELSARERSRALPGIYRTSSFSALTSAERAESPIDDAHDVDQDVTEVAEVLAPISEPPVPLDLFPRGPRAGDVLHAILEDADFERKDPEELLRLSRQHLSRQGFDATKWAEPVAVALADMLDTPLIESDPSLRLSAVSRAQRVSEMEFVFPTGGARGTVLTPERLGKVLATREGELPAGYANSVGQLGFTPLAGYLRGFIDLVFEHGGRYYVVDYKSNHLGSVASAYATRSLAAPMAHHHYFLQYHVYLVALHRHLSSRLPGYSYGKHMGGVLYLFFRGMAKERGHRTGVFFDRPSAQLVEDLSRVLGSASGKKAG